MSRKRLRVLVLTSTFPRWKGDNVPSFVFTLSNLLARFYEVLVIAPWDQGAKKIDVLGEVEVKRFQYFFAGVSLAYGGGIADNIKRFPIKLLLIPFFIVAQIIVLVREIKDERYDIIHAHWLIPQGVAAIVACYLSGIDPRRVVVCSCHGSDVNGFKGIVGTFIKAWVCRRVKVLTVVSASLKDQLSAIDNAAPIKVIPMGTDFDGSFFRNHEVLRNSLCSVFVGRLIEQKGVWVLLRAFENVVSQIPHAKLFIVGDGPLRKDVEQYLVSSGLDKNVEVLGFLDHGELPLVYNKAKVCVVPSLGNEGFGLTIVESQGCECVTLASDFASTRELISHGYNGFLFPAGKLDRLSELWVKVLMNDYSKLSSQARQSVVARYSWEATCSKFSQLFNQGVESDKNHE